MSTLSTSSNSAAAAEENNLEVNEGGADAVLDLAAGGGEAAGGAGPSGANRHRGRGRGGGGRQYPRPFDQNRPPLEPIDIPAEFIPENAVDITHDKCRKLWKLVLEPGDEDKKVKPKEKMIAQIHYKLWCLNDPEKNIFDSSGIIPEIEDGVPLEVVVGDNFIRGMKEGVLSMTRLGEKDLLIMHFDYAFGRFSSKKIHLTAVPDESMIGCEIQLVNLIDDVSGHKMKPREVIREMVETNENAQPLTNNCILFVNLEGFYDDKIFFHKRTLPFYINFDTWGYSADEMSGASIFIDFPKGLIRAVKTFKEGESGWVSLSGGSAFDEEFTGNGVVVPAEKTVRYFIELEEVQQLHDPYTLSFQEKLELSRDLLAAGNAYFHKSQFDAAGSKFISVKNYLSEAKVGLKVIKPELSVECDNLLAAAAVNLAKLYGKLHPEQMELKDAMELCNGAIQLESGGISDIDKAYYQRALLYVEQKEYSKAKDDLTKVINVMNSDMKHVQELVVECGGDGDKIQESEILPIAAAMKLLQEVKKKEIEQKKRCPVIKYVPPK